MSNTFWGLVTAGVVVSVAHVGLPSHWLPFVLVGKSQGWSPRRVLSVTAAAGLGHVVMTSLVGLLAAAVGMGFLKSVGAWSQPLTAGVLFVIGGVYLIWAWRGGHGHRHLLLHREQHHEHDDEHLHNHSHSHEHEHNHDHEHFHEHSNKTGALSDRAAFWSLFSVLTFSPCEGMVPFFFASARFGWAGLLVLAAVTGTLTVLGMMVLVSLTQAGLQRVRWQLSERSEKVLTGGLLIALGAAVLVWD